MIYGYLLTDAGSWTDKNLWIIVPSIAPPNATWTNTSSTSIRVDWSAFPRHLINGILLGYRAFIWKESDGSASKFTVDAPPEAVSASSGNLEKYTTYCGQIEAFTKVGVGPKTPIGCIRTSEDGNVKILINQHNAHLKFDIILLFLFQRSRWHQVL